jgi:hypothetical protein
MCPECFAEHSRVNNTCPFCRQEFASKVKKREIMTDEQIDVIADQWTDSVSNMGYFARARNRLDADTNEEREHYLQWLVRENGKLLMRNVSNWYEERN